VALNEIIGGGVATWSCNIDCFCFPEEEFSLVGTNRPLWWLSQKLQGV
jgi:hypothetical protein